MTSTLHSSNAPLITEPSAEGECCRAWHNYRGVSEPVFEREIAEHWAETLDEAGVEWEYSPMTFVTSLNSDGEVCGTLRPTFFLPRRNEFLLIVSCADQEKAAQQRVRELHRLRPDIDVRTCIEHEFNALCLRMRDNQSV